MSMTLPPAAPRKLLAAALAGACLAAAAPARAYDDTTTMSSVLEAVGVNMGEKGSNIDYRERPKIVLPPNRQSLPEPREASSARPNGWPSDPGVSRDHSTLVRAPRASTSVGDNGEPERNALVEPPSGYRKPTQDLSKIKDTDAKSSSWNPLSWAGKLVGSSD
jgi:hypothetical protein